MCANIPYQLYFAAGPNFDNGGDPIKDFYRILDKSDAKFVDVRCYFIILKGVIL